MSILLFETIACTFMTFLYGKLPKVFGSFLVLLDNRDLNVSRLAHLHVAIVADEGLEILKLCLFAYHVGFSHGS